MLLGHGDLSLVPENRSLSYLEGGGIPGGVKEGELSEQLNKVEQVPGKLTDIEVVTVSMDELQS